MTLSTITQYRSCGRKRNQIYHMRPLQLFRPLIHLTLSLRTLTFHCHEHDMVFGTSRIRRKNTWNLRERLRRIRWLKSIIRTCLLIIAKSNLRSQHIYIRERVPKLIPSSSHLSPVILQLNFFWKWRTINRQMARPRGSVGQSRYVFCIAYRSSNKMMTVLKSTTTPCTTCVFITEPTHRHKASHFYKNVWAHRC